NLETRTARSRLAARGKPYYRAIDPGLHLGYRKHKTGGRWVVRPYVGERDYHVMTLSGIADDFPDADGGAVLNFAQAQAAARALYISEARRFLGAPSGPFTLEDAIDAYVEFLTAKNPHTADDTGRRLHHHVEEKDRARAVGDLDQEWIERWHRKMGRKSDDPEDVRRSKDTANRTLTMLKAALNHVYADPKKRKERGLTSADAWREVKPFKGVGRAREVHLDPAECTRLINATSGAFRNLV